MSQSQPGADEPAWPAPAYAWYIVAVLLLAYTLSFVDRTILSLLIAPLRASMHISDTQVSLLLGLAFAVFYTLMGLPIGWVADHWSRRTLIGVGIAVWSVMTAGCGLARTFGGLFLMRIGVGVGEATLSPAAFSMISDYFPKARLGRALAVYSIGVPLGSGVALALGALVIKTLLKAPPFSLPLLGLIEPWRLSFLWVGLPGLLVALLMFTVREPLRRGRLVSAEAGAPEGFGAFVLANRAALACHMGGVSLLVLVIYGFMAWIPTFFARTYGIAPADAGLGFGVITAICGAAGLIAGGALADRWFAKGVRDAHMRVILGCVAGTAVLFIGVCLAPSAAAAFGLLVPAMFVAPIHGGVAGAALQLIAPNAMRARVSALYLFVANLIGLGLGPTAVALVTDYGLRSDNALRYSMAIVAAVALPLSALLIFLGLAPFRRAVIAGDQILKA